MQTSFPSLPRALCIAITAGFVMAGCGGSDAPWVTPAAPTGLGRADSVAMADATTVPPFVDNVATNQRGDARYATLATNAGVRVVAGFLDIWRPSSLIVDAGITAVANGSFPAVVASTWSGIPGDSTDGTVLNTAVHTANIQYVATATTNRTPAQELAAYLDDRRNKAYSVSDGMGPLTTAWRTASQQTTSITGIAADATTVLYNDTGNDVGVGGSANTQNFGPVVDLVSNIGENGSTEPAKRFYKYTRPWRWSSNVQVVPALVPAKSSTPKTDGGFVSGHSAEAVRRGLAMAYVVPERFQEMLTRAGELGENRILAGMHSPMDVMGGRIQGQAVAAASLYSGINSSTRVAVAAQARSTLMAAVGAADPAAFNTLAHAQSSSADRFADHATNKANYRRYLTYGFTQIADTTQPATVPKGAEVLLETRLPYLSADQRRVVLKTTAIASGYPVLDDAEGWGRLNLFDAADGYARLDGDVAVTMDASLLGFNALDSWQNNIAGAGLLTKRGSGQLTLTGSNTYSGGTVLEAGTLEGTSATAFGSGDVFQSGGILRIRPVSQLTLATRYTQTGGTLQLVLGNANQIPLAVASDATLGGALNIRFAPGYQPAVGTLLTVISAGRVHGTFSSIMVDGHTVSPVYTGNQVQLRIVS